MSTKSSVTTRLSMSKLPSNVLAAINREMQQISQVFPYPMALIHNPFQIRLADDLFLYLLIVDLSELSDDSSESIRSQMGQYLRGNFSDQLSRIASCRGDFQLFFLLPGALQKWCEGFADHPEEFPLKNGASGASLISPVLFGQNLMDTLCLKAQAFFGPDILSFWVQAAHDRNEARRMGLAEYRKDLYQQEEYQRHDFLNRYEMSELAALVNRVKVRCANGNISRVVALEGSGRPIGKLLWRCIGKDVPIDYLDPRPLRSLLNWDNYQDNNKLKYQVLSLLFSEFPDLSNHIQSAPLGVLNVDDHVSTGRTFDTVRFLVSTVIGDNIDINTEVMSQNDGMNVPSWWMQRRIQQTRIEAEYLTFVSPEKLTAHTMRLDYLLKKEAEKWGIL